MAQEMAQKQAADIYFGDAAHMRSDHHAGRTWAKKVKRPLLKPRARVMHELDLSELLARPYAVHDQGKRRRQR